MTTDPNELARAALAAAARAHAGKDRALEARLKDVADDRGQLTIENVMGVLAGAHPAATELRAATEDKAARNRALIDLLHNPQIEEDNET